MGRQAEVRAKQAMVTEFLRREGLDGVLLSRRENFSWMTAGAVNHIPSNEEVGGATLLVTPDEIVALTTNIEAPRILAEEVGELGIPTRSWPWYHDKQAEISAILGSKVCGSDDGVAGTRNVTDSFAPLRYSLLSHERERYRELGKDAAEALENAAQRVAPGMSEFAISATLASEVIQRGMEPTVNLVAVDERVFGYRHPIPTAKVLGKYAMLVLCARRGGLIVAATRLVHFGRRPEELRRKHEAVCQVEAAMYGATKPGVRVSEILSKGIATYAIAGYPGEWELHHQGGPAGYKNREYVATPDSKHFVRNHQAFAWNPSITGTKNEDTILVNGDGFEVVTVGAGDWPVIEVTTDNRVTIGRPDVLEK